MVVEKESSALLFQVVTSPVDSSVSISLCLLTMSAKLMLDAIGVKSALVLENVPFICSRAVNSVCIRRVHTETERAALSYQ